MATVNVDTQMTTAYWLIHLVNCSLPLTESYSQLLSKDQYKYFVDSLSVNPDDPGMAAIAAADYAKYTMDSSIMDSQTGYQNTMVQDEKTQVRTLGNSMDQIYTLEEPMEQILKQTVHEILGF